ARRHGVQAGSEGADKTEDLSPPTRTAWAGCNSEELFTIRNYLFREIMLDFTCSVIMLCPSRSIFEGRFHEASCERGTGAAPASEGLTQPSSPGGPRAASSATRSRPGPTTVEGIKAKMPRWCAARRGVHRKCTHRPEQSGHPARSNPGTAPCRRADPLDAR